MNVGREMVFLLFEEMEIVKTRSYYNEVLN